MTARQAKCEAGGCYISLQSDNNVLSCKLCGSAAQLQAWLSAAQLQAWRRCWCTLFYARVSLLDSVHLLVEADFFLVPLQLWQVPRSTSNDPQQWLEAAAGPPPGGARTSTPAPVEQPLELPAPPAVPAVKAEPVDAGQAGPQKPQVGILITPIAQSCHELA